LKSSVIDAALFMCCNAHIILSKSPFGLMTRSYSCVRDCQPASNVVIGSACSEQRIASSSQDDWHDSGGGGTWLIAARFVRVCMFDRAGCDVGTTNINFPEKTVAEDKATQPIKTTKIKKPFLASAFHSGKIGCDVRGDVVKCKIVASSFSKNAKIFCFSNVSGRHARTLFQKLPGRFSRVFE